MLRTVSLFSGVGMLDYGLTLAGGFEHVLFCESDPWRRGVLRQRWPGVPVHDDIRTLAWMWRRWPERCPRPIDIVVGGSMPGRISAVHCMDIPTGNSGGDALLDFPGDIIRWHRDRGFGYVARHHVWKEPLTVRNRTMKKDLAHRTIVDDSSRCSVASADYLLIFRREGENPIPIEHPSGLTEYAGERAIPAELHRFRGHEGKQTENQFSHWIWRRYADAFWDDVRLDRVLPYKPARDQEDEKHIHPLQLDVIDRVLVLRSNPGETVLTPFMGVGSEVYSAVRSGRRAIGIELKPSYYRQAVKNLTAAVDEGEQIALGVAA